MGERIIGDGLDDKIYSTLKIVHPKTDEPFCTYNGFFYANPFVKESFHFFQMIGDKQLPPFKVHITSLVKEVKRLDKHTAIRYRIRDENSVYLLTIFGKRIF